MSIPQITRMLGPGDPSIWPAADTGFGNRGGAYGKFENRGGADGNFLDITRALAFEHMYPPNLSPIPHLDEFWANFV